MNQPIRPWSKDKLELLGKYLRAYTGLMRRQKWLRGCAFVDSFAGAGQFHDPETLEYVDGSPLVALRCVPSFDEYCFIDLSATKIRALEGKLGAAVAAKVAFHQGDANDIPVREIASRITYDSYRRGFVFLDPYGLQVHWSTVQALAKTRALDVFVNFPIMGINRLIPREARPDVQAFERLRSIFEDTAWIDGLYTIQGGLFGESASVRNRLGAEQLAQRYTEDLRGLFPHVSRVGDHEKLHQLASLCAVSREPQRNGCEDHQRHLSAVFTGLLIDRPRPSSNTRTR